MMDRVVVPNAAATAIASSRPPAPRPATTATHRAKHTRSAFGEIDPITQTKFWPQIKREREEHAAHLDELQAAHRAARKRCARLEADGGAGDAAEARRLLRRLLKVVHPYKASGNALDPHAICAKIAEVLGVLGDPPVA